MKCLIVANNNVNKLSNDSQCKPSSKVLGLTLVERSIRAALSAGVKDITVLTSEKDDLKRPLSRLGLSMGVSINTVEYDMKSPKDCIAAMTRVGKFFKQSFLLMTPFNIVNSELLQKLVAKPIRDGEIAVAIDSNQNNSLVDINHNYKALIKGGRVEKFGRGVPKAQGYDTGVYYCTPILFKALISCGKNGHFSIQHAISMLSEHKRVKAVNVGKMFWVAVKDKETLKIAEDALVAECSKQVEYDHVSWYVHRPLAIMLSKHIANLSVTPKQMRLVTYLFGTSACFMFFANNFLLALFAGVATFMMTVMDGMDKHISILTYQPDDSSEEYRALFDQMSILLILLGFSWHVYVSSDSMLSGLLGFIAIIGLVFQNQLAEKGTPFLKKYRLGKGLLSILILVGLVVNFPNISLLLIAIYCNALVGYHFYTDKEKNNRRLA